MTLLGDTGLLSWESRCEVMVFNRTKRAGSNRAVGLKVRGVRLH